MSGRLQHQMQCIPGKCCVLPLLYIHPLALHAFSFEWSWPGAAPPAQAPTQMLLLSSCCCSCPFAIERYWISYFMLASSGLLCTNQAQTHLHTHTHSLIHIHAQKDTTSGKGAFSFTRLLLRPATLAHIFLSSY